MVMVTPLHFQWPRGNIGFSKKLHNLIFLFKVHYSGCGEEEREMNKNVPNSSFLHHAAFSISLSRMCL